MKPGNHIENRPLKEIEGVTRLFRHGDWCRSYLIGLPEFGQRPKQGSLILAPRRQGTIQTRHGKRLCQFRQSLGDTLQFVQHGAAAGFGGMRGQGRADINALNQRLHLCGIQAVRLQFQNRLTDRLRARRPLTASLPLPVDPHDFLLLGGVYQLEKDRERPQKPLNDRRIRKFRQSRQKCLGIAPCLCPCDRDQPMGKRNQILALLLPKHIAQQLVQQFYVFGKRSGKAAFAGRQTKKRGVLNRNDRNGRRRRGAGNNSHAAIVPPYFLDLVTTGVFLFGIGQIGDGLNLHIRAERQGRHLERRAGWFDLKAAEMLSVDLVQGGELPQIREKHGRLHDIL